MCRATWLVALVSTLALVRIAAAAPGAPNEPEYPAPTLTVEIEEVDTSQYPAVEVAFRVVDTNPNSGYQPLQPAHVQVHEGRAGEAAPATVEQWFPPRRRPLAMAIALDRSGSVKKVLPKIRKAIGSYISMMSEASKNDPPLPDQTFLMAFAGGEDLRKRTVHHEFTADRSALDAFAKRAFAKSYGGSPVYRAVEATLAQAAALEPYRYPQAARAMVCLTDGINNRPRKDKAARLLALAATLGVPAHPIGMVQFNKFGVSRGKIRRGELEALARVTRGAYMQPVSPFPVLPVPPEPDEDVLPHGFALEDASEFLEDALPLLANIYREMGGAPATPLEPGLRELVAATVPSLGATPTRGALIAAFAGGTPPLSPESLTPALVEQAIPPLRQLARAVVTDEELKLQSYYDEQLSQQLQKIRDSLKNLYRVRFQAHAPRYEGRDREITLAVSYASEYRLGRVQLSGSATRAYAEPRVVSEDEPLKVALAATGLEEALAQITGPRDPAGGGWAGKLEVEVTRRIWVERTRPGADHPGLPVRVAEAGPSGKPTFAPPFPDALAAEPLPEREFAPWLEALDAGATIEGGTPARLWLTARPRVPGCVPALSDPGERPRPDAADPAGARLSWYELSITLARPYDHRLSLPRPRGQEGADVVVRRRAARVTLPAASLFVADRTPPALSLEIGADAGARVRLERWPDPPEVAPYGPRYLASGQGFGLAPGPKAQALRRAPDDGLDLEPEPHRPGLVIPEGVRLRIRVRARDNMDRNRDQGHLAGGAQRRPSFHDLAGRDDEVASAATFSAPFLMKRSFADVGHMDPDGYLAGVGWQIWDAADQVVEEPDTHVFRAPNQLRGTNPPAAKPGEEMYLEASASDASGNVARLRVPLIIVQSRVSIERLSLSERRAR